MNKSKIFMTTGALILSISAIFATKTNKKFTASVTTGFLVSGSGTAAIRIFPEVFTTHRGTGWVPVYAIVYTETLPISPNGNTINGQLLDASFDPVLINHSSGF
jgi:hypothetical protein